MNYNRLRTVYNGIKRNPVLFRSLLSLMRLTGRRYLNVRIDTTNFCNLRCKMCYLSMDKNSKRMDMDKETFHKVANKFFSKTRMLYLSCGAEPLVNPNFTEFLSISSGYGIPFRSFATNGMLLEKKVIDSCVDNRIEEVIVSLDGSKKETVQSIRIGSNFDRVIGNLKKLDQAVSDSPNHFPRIRINFTLMRSNFHELEKAIHYYSEFKNVYIIDIRHMRIHEGMEMNDEVLTKNHQREYDDIIKRMEKYCREKRILLQHSKKCFVEAADMKDKDFCPIPLFSIYIDSEGDVRLCPYVKEGISIDHFELMDNQAIRNYLKKHSPNCGICETND
jgi:MoaA/NifB/PqqE/SkfB family radical SAM enzyme